MTRYSPRASVLLNGIKSSEFKLGRSTRQGDPISQLIFALAMSRKQRLLEFTVVYQASKYDLLHVRLCCLPMMSWCSFTTLSRPYQSRCQLYKHLGPSWDTKLTLISHWLCLLDMVKIYQTCPTLHSLGLPWDFIK